MKHRFMSRLKEYREIKNLTQEELSEQSGVSVRTIQRIEAGTPPKGHTLKTLAQVFEIEEKDLLDISESDEPINYTLLKVINIAVLPFIIFPPANILVPLLIMWAKKQYHSLAKQIVSLQIIWTVVSVITVFLTAIIRNAFWLPDDLVPISMLIMLLANVFIILRNAAAIDKQKQLAIRLNFNVI